MDIITGNIGWIEVICGPMFSGKSEELIRRLRRAMIARKRVEVFKPGIDDRYSENEIVSHGDLRMQSQVVTGAAGDHRAHRLARGSGGHRRSQLHGPELVEVAQRLADSGKQVIIAGLDTDYLGRPFAPIPDLLAHAESITKTLADLRALRQSRQAHAAAARLRRPDRGGRRRYVRSALPALLRARHSQADRDRFRESPPPGKRPCLTERLDRIGPHGRSSNVVK